MIFWFSRVIKEVCFKWSCFCKWLNDSLFAITSFFRALNDLTNMGKKTWTIILYKRKKDKNNQKIWGKAIVKSNWGI